MATGCYSDHILISKAYDMWLECRKEGTDAVYVRDHFLHRGTLTMIEGVYTHSLYIIQWNLSDQDTIGSD